MARKKAHSTTHKKAHKKTKKVHKHDMWKTFWNRYCMM